MLGLGKFDPSTDVKLCSSEFQAIEIESSLFLKQTSNQRHLFLKCLSSQSLRLLVRVSIRSEKTMEEWADLFSVLSDSLGDRILYVTFYVGYKSHDELRDEAKLRTLKLALKGTSFRYAFEAGQADDFKSMAYLKRMFPQAQKVLDLSWHQIPRGETVAYFKLNGWHSERWVRRYGELQIQKLCKSLHKGSLLVLSHSGRFEEASLFKK